MNLSNNGKKLSDFLDEKMMEQSFTNEDLVHFIEQVGRYLNLETLPNYAVKHKMSYNDYKYTPNNKFKGYTECLSVNPINAYGFWQEEQELINNKNI